MHVFKQGIFFDWITRGMHAPQNKVNPDLEADKEFEIQEMQSSVVQNPVGTSGESGTVTVATQSDKQSYLADTTYKSFRDKAGKLATNPNKLTNYEVFLTAERKPGTKANMREDKAVGDTSSISKESGDATSIIEDRSDSRSFNDDNSDSCKNPLKEKQHPPNQLKNDDASKINQIHLQVRGNKTYANAFTQTYFKQGFLKLWQTQENPVVKITRRNSDTLKKQPLQRRMNSLALMMERKAEVQNRWQLLIDWAHERRRSNSIPHKGYNSGPCVDEIAIFKCKTHSSQTEIGASPTHLDAYLNFMYYVCVSTRDVDASSPGLQKWASSLQKVWFWIFSTFAIAHSLDLLKYSTTEFLENGKLHDYIHLGFLLICCIIRIYSLTLHIFRNDKFKIMSQAMNEAALGATTSKNISASVYLLGGSSLLMAFLYSLFENRSFKEWSFQDSILSRAYEMGHTVLMLSNTNTTSRMNVHFATSKSFKMAAMTIPDFVLSFCGNLEDFVLGDLMLTSAVSLYTNLYRYEKDIKSMPAANVTYLEFKRKWEEYQILARASETFYATCGTLPTLYHLYNLLQFAAFLRLILVKRTAYFIFISTAVNVTKSIATYYNAGKISEKNKTCRNWVRNCAFHSLSRKHQKNRKLYMKAILMLDEMKDNPIGLGRDEMFISKGFLITFLGMGASVFVMLAEFAGESKNC